jgi:predicted RNA-binding Zn ribbon-like protein
VSTGETSVNGKMPGMSDELGLLASLEVDGGNLGLDFANTINSRVKPTMDYIGAYPGLVAWAERVDVLGSETRRALLAHAATDPIGTERALNEAHGLRDAIFRAFSAIAAGEPPPITDVTRILKAYGHAVARASVLGDPGRTPLGWTVGSRLAGVLDPVAHAAGGLLLAPDRPTVKECPGCGWLFVDRSRNGNRRWCDMRTCGSRDKMRRYYRLRRSPGQNNPQLTDWD